jgi:hypothetical protein
MQEVAALHHEHPGQAGVLAAAPVVGAAPARLPIPRRSAGECVCASLRALATVLTPSSLAFRAAERAHNGNAIAGAQRFSGSRSVPMDLGA